MEYKTQLSPWHRSLLDQPWWQPHCPGRSGAGEHSAAGRPRGRPVPGITAPAPASPTEEKGKTNRKGVRRMSGHRFKLLGPKVIAQISAAKDDRQENYRQACFNFLLYWNKMVNQAVTH